jgi:hypothetical protein
MLSALLIGARRNEVIPAGGGMFGFGTPLFVVAVLGGLVILFGVGTLLFQAGCALADVPVRGYFRSLSIYALAVLLCGPLMAALVWFAGRYESDANASFGTMRIVALIVSLLLAWLLSSGVYALLLAASLGKGLWIAGVELLLMGLLAALVSAVVLVVLAVVQIATRPPAKADRNTLPIVRVLTPAVLP